jgi:outer membrane protein OmpA-like peptidoglycan-associated protein
MRLSRPLGAALALAMALIAPAAAQASPPGPPAVVADTGAYDFGDTPVHGMTSHVFTLTNTSATTATAYLGTDGPAGTDANGEDHCSGATLAPGESCTVLVSLLPDIYGDVSLGVRTGHLLIASDLNASTSTVTLTGTAVPMTPDAAGSIINGQFNQGKPAFGVQHVDPDATQVTLYVDGQADGSTGAVNADGTATITPDVALSDGAHTLTFSQTVQGYTSQSGSDTPVMVNTAAPTVDWPVDGQLYPNSRPGVVVRGALANLPVNYYIDGQLVTSLNAGYDGYGGLVSVDMTALDDGTHTVQVSTTDTNGHEGVKSPVTTFVIDATAPDAPAITGGPQGTVTSTTAPFVFSGEPGARFWCSLDGGGWAPCTSPQTYTGLTAGQHTFAVIQFDTAGHSGPVATQAFAVAHPGTSNPPTPDASELTVIAAKTGTVDRGRVLVGCRLNAGQLRSCAVTAYAGGVKVGRSTVRFAGGELGTVPVKLNARGLRLVHRVHGVKLTYRAQAGTSGGKTLRAKGASRMLPLTVAAVPYDGLFASGSTKLNHYGQRFVRSLANQLGGAKRVACTGYTDSIGSAAANQRLGLARARTVCAQLRTAGVRARMTVRSQGERHPRATNRTAAGRAMNRRAELLVRYR